MANPSSNIIPQQQNFTLEYTPSDFFYLTNAADMPPGLFGCSNLAQTVKGCSAQGMTSLNANSCYQNALCQNQTLVNELYAKRDKHSQAQAKLLDIYRQYQFQVLTTFNLGVGLAITASYIYYNR